LRNRERSIVAAAIIAIITVAMTPAAACLSLGVKTGDWIEYDIQGSVNPEYSLTVSFLNVTGTNLTIELTESTLIGAPLNYTENIDFSTNEDFPIGFLTARACLIPNGSETGDSVYLGTEFGNRTITSETTRSYAGADRIVVGCNFTNQLNQYVFYWDKQTGVLLEATMSHGTTSSSLSATDTNMWTGLSDWWLLPIIVGVIALGILSSRRKAVKKPDGKNSRENLERTASELCSGARS
jgi:hypothetical protein